MRRELKVIKTSDFRLGNTHLFSVILTLTVRKQGQEGERYLYLDISDSKTYTYLLTARHCISLSVLQSLSLSQNMLCIPRFYLLL